MKIPLLFLSSLFTAALYAQEGRKADPPAKVIPPVKLAEKSETSSKTSVKKRYVPRITKSQAAAAPATRPAPRRVVLPSNAASSRTPSSGPPPAGTAMRVPGRPPVIQPQSNNLTENITIQLQGSVVGGPELDLSMTGIGPLFRGDVVAGDDPAILTHTYSVVKAGDGYKVEYSIGLRLKVENKTDGRVNIEFRDVVVTGTALAKEGKRLVISRNGDRELGLTLGRTGSK